MHLRHTAHHLVNSQTDEIAPEGIVAVRDLRDILRLGEAANGVGAAGACLLVEGEGGSQ